MFNQVFENFRQATEATIDLQQEMFKTWVNLWPGVPATSTSWSAEVREFQRKWADAVDEMLKRQRDVTGAHFKAGLQNIDKAFKLGEAKTAEELRAKSLELWQKCFEDLRQVYESQLKGFEGAMEKWVELTKKGAACGAV
jgi:hypothetical protein